MINLTLTTEADQQSTLGTGPGALLLIGSQPEPGCRGLAGPRNRLQHSFCVFCLTLLKIGQLTVSGVWVET